MRIAIEIGIVGDEAEPGGLLHLRIVLEAVGFGEVAGGDLDALGVAAAVHAQEHFQAVAAG